MRLILFALCVVGLAYLITRWINPETVKTKESLSPTMTFNDSKIYIVQLPDGTRCAILEGFIKGGSGIDCDWR